MNAQVWNLRTGQREADFRWRSYFVRSPDGYLLASHVVKEGAHVVEVCKLPSGKVVGAVPVNGSGDLVFSPDGRFLAYTRDLSPGEVSMIEVATMKSVWHVKENAFVSSLRFSPDSRTTYTLQENLPRQIRVHDCSTGAVKARIAIPEIPPTMRVSFRTTLKRGAMLIQQGSFADGEKNAPLLTRLKEWIPWLKKMPDRQNDLVLVADPDTGRERLRLVGYVVNEAFLAEDGNTLVTVHPMHEGRPIRCWDVDAWKPLTWPIGVPAALGAMVVVFAWWRGRRAKKAATTPSA